MKTLGLWIFGLGVIGGIIFSFSVGTESDAFRSYFPIFIGMYIMGMLLFFAGMREQQPHRRSTRCGRCGTTMFIITGMMVRRDVFTRSHGCFQCGRCGQYTCYDCSDSRQPCECGARHWIEKTYLMNI
jgi:hypothetical protein